MTLLIAIYLLGVIPFAYWIPSRYVSKWFAFCWPAFVGMLICIAINWLWRKIWR